MIQTQKRCNKHKDNHKRQKKDDIPNHLIARSDVSYDYAVEDPT